MTGWQADEASGEVAAGSMLELRWPALGVELSLGVLEVVPERRVVLAEPNRVGCRRPCREQ